MLRLLIGSVLCAAVLLGLPGTQSKQSPANAPASPGTTPETATHAAVESSASAGYPASATSSVSSVTPSASPSLTSTATMTLTATFDPRDVPSHVISWLQAAGAIPPGGRLLFQVPIGYALTGGTGYNFLPLGAGQKIQDFVVGMQLGWQSLGLDSGCGISFRAGDSDWRSLIITGRMQVLFTHQQGAAQIVNIDQSTAHFDPKSRRNAITLLVFGDSYSLYLDGQPEAAFTDTTGGVTAGSFSLEVYDPPDNVTLADCIYSNLWVWSFDPLPSSPTVSPTPPVTHPALTPISGAG